MANKVVVVANQKGGVGKSTLCIGLGVEASRGERTGLVDTDLQGTLTKWHKRRIKRREDDSLLRAEVPLDKLGAGLRALDRQGYGFTFIDTSPSRADELRQIIDLASLVLIPARPSLADIEAMAPTIRMAKDAGKPFAFVINFVKPGARQTAQAVAVLSQQGPVIEHFIGDRTLIADCLTEGLSAAEASPKGPAAKEIACLWASVRALLHS